MPTTCNRPPLRQLGRYLADEELGRGGMGIVYRGWDPDLERPVAIKVLLAAHMERPESIQRFLRESRAIARLQHPDIVRIYCSGIENGTPWFTMQLIQGKSLAECLDEGLADLHALTLLHQVSTALDYAHAHGVVHRDLKPSNVMMTKEGRAQIVDFGVAHIQEEPPMTRSGEILGTVRYMAPEQIKGHPGSVGPAADMWALGVLLYRTLCGQLPFDGTSDIEVMTSILRQRPKPPRSLRQDIPHDLDCLIRWCLDAEPSKRPSAAQAMVLLSRVSSTWNPHTPGTSPCPAKHSKPRNRSPSSIRVGNVTLLAMGFAVVLMSGMLGFSAGTWGDRALSDLGLENLLSRSESPTPRPPTQIALESQPSHQSTQARLDGMSLATSASR